MIELKPDIAFKKELERISKSSLSTCMQCGTCSVVCKLSPDNKPFPRKEMVYASWGMRDKLIGNPDLWLCHQCGDCSTYCPRGVNPSDVLGAARQLTYQRFAKPAFMAKLLNRPAYLPLAIMLPVIIIGLIIFLAGTLSIPEGPVNYSAFFPHAWLNASFTFITLLSYGTASYGLIRYWKNMKTWFPEAELKWKFWKSAFNTQLTVMSHSKFNACKKNKSRKISHFLVFYGFLILLLVTLYAIYAAVTEKYPLSFLNPFKVLGNISSLMLFAGLGIMIINRITRREGTERTSYADWLLLISMFLLTISGSVIEAARFFDWRSAYYLYYFHLVCVWFVIIYLPYTKFGHIIFRFLAMIYAVSIDRK